MDRKLLFVLVSIIIVLGWLATTCSQQHIEQTLPQPKDKNFMYVSSSVQKCFVITPGVRKCTREDGSTVTIVDM